MDLPIIRRFLIAAFVVFLVSCSAARIENAVEPSSEPPLSRGLGYGLILSSYAQVRDIPDSSGVSLGYYRRGSVVPVSERRSVKIGNSYQTWILNEGRERGWIIENEIGIYDNEAKAKTASKKLGS
ncbi:hypothetical protein MASR2M78_00710 [Treponema sp.]